MKLFIACLLIYGFEMHYAWYGVTLVLQVCLLLLVEEQKN